jgi:hypothetical protein
MAKTKKTKPALRFAGKNVVVSERKTLGKYHSFLLRDRGDASAFGDQRFRYELELAGSLLLENTYGRTPQEAVRRMNKRLLEINALTFKLWSQA